MAREWFKPGRQTQLAITCTCLQAFLLFGYDQGVFGGLITNKDFLDTFGHPGTGFLGIIVSIYNIGCLLGCLLNFIWGNKFGRRQAIWISIAFVSIGAALQCTAYSVEQLMIGRVITGLGVGIDTSTVPMYLAPGLYRSALSSRSQAELCRSEVRGRLVTTEVLFTGLGVSGAYFFVYGMSHVGGPLAWRLPIACQVIFALIVSILMFGLPETPRWLLEKGRIEEAEVVMTKIFGLPKEDEYIRAEKTAIITAIEMELATPFEWTRLFKADRMATGWRVFLACLVLFMNQWAGINVIVFYAPTVLETNVGLSKDTSLVVGGCINLAFAIGSIVPSIGLDKMGRRKPMMIGSFGMGLSMMMIAILLSFEKPGTSEAAIAFFLTFMLCFGASLNAIPWCYSAEILPLKARAKGTSLAVLNNWLWVFVIVMVTPTMVSSITWKTYLVFMCCNFAFIPMIYFWFPETKGLSLEEIDYLFIKESTREIGEMFRSSDGSGSDESKSERRAVHVEVFFTGLHISERTKEVKDSEMNRSFSL
ncbi:sugar transporter protein [Rutstroemia sp. NJR-2017a WRK4]|nr:sugar transporter protein [Rutstroemia sp. NJR-2017a WRK4]